MRAVRPQPHPAFLRGMPCKTPSSKRGRLAAAGCPVPRGGDARVSGDAELPRERMSGARQFGRFLIVGAVNTAASYAAYLLLLRHVSHLVAYSLAYALGIVISYFLNTYFVFRARAAAASFVRFPLVYLLQYLVGAAVLHLAVEQFGISREIAFAFSVAVTIPVTFFASKLVLGKRAP